MTTTAAPALNPQILGQAENAHRAVLDGILAGTGADYRQWVTLKFAGTGSDTVERDDLARRTSGALKIDAVASHTTITDLIESGLLEAPSDAPTRIGFTTTGRARHAEIAGAIGAVMRRAYADIPADDLATAGRVLTLITARINAELTGP
ncbi:MarR family transcriptional regulator [Embleya sp. NPDC005575]|uniref:MarR family transcriptional regulator n=1 Tax=Embleya sp. NPDC005575 TaxID=3156892 RepID=UPI0033A4BCCC